MTNALLLFFVFLALVLLGVALIVGGEVVLKAVQEKLVDREHDQSDFDEKRL